MKRPAPVDRPCKFCRVIHSYKETCAQAKARVAPPARQSKPKRKRKATKKVPA